MAGWTTISVLRIDRHVSGVDFLVSNALGAIGLVLSRRAVPGTDRAPSGDAGHPLLQRRAGIVVGEVVPRHGKKAAQPNCFWCGNWMDAVGRRLSPCAGASVSLITPSPASAHR